MRFGARLSASFPRPPTPRSTTAQSVGPWANRPLRLKSRGWRLVSVLPHVLALVGLSAAVAGDLAEHAAVPLIAQADAAEVIGEHRLQRGDRILCWRSADGMESWQPVRSVFDLEYAKATSMDCGGLELEVDRGTERLVVEWKRGDFAVRPVLKLGLSEKERLTLAKTRSSGRFDILVSAFGALDCEQQVSAVLEFARSTALQGRDRELLHEFVLKHLPAISKRTLPNALDGLASALGDDPVAGHYRRESLRLVRDRSLRRVSRLVSLARLHRDRGEFPETLAICQELVGVRSTYCRDDFALANARSNLAAALTLNNQVGAAAPLQRSEIESVDDPEFRLTHRLNLVAAEYRRGLLSTARDELQTACESLPKDRVKSTTGARVAHLLALIERESGNLSVALDLLAALLNEQVLTASQEARFRISLADTLRLVGDRPAAHRIASLATQDLQGRELSCHRAASAYNILGLIAHEVKDYDGARGLFASGLRCESQTGARTALLQALTSNLGLTELEDGNLIAAAALQAEALAIASAADNQDAIAVDKKITAELLERAGHDGAASGLYQAAADMLAVHAPASDHYVESLAGVARIHRRHGRLEPAAICYRQAVGLLRHQRRDPPAAGELAVLDMRYGELWRDLVELLVRLGQDEEASAVATSFGSVALQVRTSGVSTTSSRPLSSCRAIGSWLDVSFGEEGAKTRAPAKRPRRSLSEASIGECARTGILRYVVGKDATVLFIHDANGTLQAHTISVTRDELSDLSDEVRDLLVSGANHSDSRSAHSALAVLGSLLLSTIESFLREHERILLVLDGPLATVPFAALRQNESADYLVKRHQLVATPFVGSVKPLRQPPCSMVTPMQDVLALVDPHYNQASAAATQWGHPPPLSEGFVVADSLASYWSNTTVMKGQQATEAALRHAVGQYDILHLNAHAVLDDTRPWRSALILADPNDGDSKSDGVLYASEIREDLAVGAQLVVLAGCSTAEGYDGGSEGPLGLAAAFFQTGTQHVLASAWPVDEKATAWILDCFYHALSQEDANPARALQAAQLAALESPDFAHPYYWAAWLLSEVP